MLDKTLGYVLCCQSPALFLAALVLIIHYFAARRKHRFKAVLKLLLGIVCAVGGVVLYYLGMYHEYFTIAISTRSACRAGSASVSWRF